MMTQAELTALQERLRQLVVTDIGEAIRALKEALPDGSSRENAVLSLEGRLNDANRQRLRGVLSADELQRAYNQIRADLIDFIGSLEAADFAPPAAATLPPDKTGSLLYKIPDQMQVAHESRCVIRLAYEEESIIRDIELSDDVHLRDIRIAEVMDVALVDPNPEPTFAIRSVSSDEQFIERGDYTEWIFFVRPLREGVFPLLLKVSVVEIIQGKERRKDIVLEESVQIITATVPEEADDGAFKSSGYTLTGASAARPAPPPQAPVIMPYVSPRSVDKPAAPRRRSAVRRLAPLATVLLLATVAAYIFFPSENKLSNEVKTEHVSPSAQDTIRFTPSMTGPWRLTAYEASPSPAPVFDSLFGAAGEVLLSFPSDDSLLVRSAGRRTLIAFRFLPGDSVVLQTAAWQALGALTRRADSLTLRLEASAVDGTRRQVLLRAVK